MLNYLGMNGAEGLARLEHYHMLWTSRREEIDPRIEEAVEKAKRLASEKMGTENVDVYITYEGEVLIRVSPHETKDEMADLTNLVVFSRHGYDDDETLSRMIGKDCEEGPYDPGKREYYKELIDVNYDLYTLDSEEFDCSSPSIVRLELRELEEIIIIQRNLA
ncbi:hypothetical protein [Sulfoacidibacillus ferrooxidans]|uniref:Uncharacterized protein n=1 Tax=Sulfoacidibacillus ferrooxidans TaxID=2005001 RepID=A0A9X1VBS7_9BACL|nr:hypothetical protein [Sulfoacidibacillus ferrooxidans]MCI0184594.1 hypothetical protein [Sulfoacidibacillus ferrooxidans]